HRGRVKAIMDSTACLERRSLLRDLPRRLLAEASESHAVDKTPESIAAALTVPERILLFCLASDTG
ncbi:MAG: hypothetical protein ACHQ9S_27820, partial [Candidatus Binatia bacterium]